MKKLLLLALVVLSMTLQAQVKIGNNPTTINSSSLLELESTTKGLLPPRMTSAQMNAITTPATGLYVHCSNCSPVGLHFFNGTAWKPVGDTSSGGSSSSGGVSATMAIGGTWIWGGTSVTRNIVINITNNSFSTAAWNNVNTNLVLSGGNTGLTVGTPSPATTSIASGLTGTITFPVTGPVDTMDEITATWKKLALTVVGTQAITPGSATFTNATNNAFVFSAYASGVNTVGTLANGTTLLLPYTAGSGSYSEYTSPDITIPSQYCNNGETGWTFAYSYLAGTFAATGNITATLITKKNGTITAWPAFQVTDIATINFNCVSVPLVVNGATLSNTVGIDEGGDAIRGQLSTSGAAYDAAAVNDWIPITAAEYTSLATNVTGGTNGGVPIADFNTTSVALSGTVSSYANTNATVGLPSGYTSIPSSRYVYAVRLKTGVSNGTTFAGSKIKLSSVSGSSSFNTLGSALPAHTSAMATNSAYAFVLKRPTFTSNLPVNIGVFAKSYYIGYLNAPSHTSIFAGGDATTLSSNVSQHIPQITYLTTLTKSW